MSNTETLCKCGHPESIHTTYHPSNVMLCVECDCHGFRKAESKQERANRLRRERDQIRRDCGLVRVKGALGGTYWE